MMNKLFLGELIQIKNEIGETADIVIYFKNKNDKSCRLCVIKNESNLDILDNLKLHFKFESIIYIEDDIKYYNIVINQNVFLNYNCLITKDHELIDTNSFLKNIDIRDFVEKYTANDLLSIKPLISAILVDYQLISVVKFYSMIKYSRMFWGIKKYKMFIFFNTP